MADINSKEYDPIRTWVKNARNRDKPWDLIESKFADDGFFTSRIEEDFWPEDSRKVWLEIVSAVKKNEEHTKELNKQVEKATLLGPGQKNILEVPEDESSCWGLYRKKLEKRGFTNIDNIQVECLNILRNLYMDTIDTRPVKGLVVGNVQSGKTANMAGLISMAADCGWNFFIVLSGTIESLRQQTSKRLLEDLSDDRIDKFAWRLIDKLNIRSTECTPQSINLSENSHVKYLTVCLKNKKRLTDMLTWINLDLNKKKQMRILLIDDEADQASINTAAPLEERKTINRLIVNLVEGRDSKGEEKGKYRSMNYVAYTATPYANFLSEGSEESLYPRDFITLLTPPNLYFGPEEIFGSDNKSGLSIINTYEDVDVAVRRLENSNSDDIPRGLKDAICWFLCCVSILRVQKYGKPVSMLIHTSLYTDAHKGVAKGVLDYLNSDKREIMEHCREIYSREKEMLSPKRFRNEYPNYGRMDNIQNYPEFGEFEKTLSELININATHIKIDEEKRICYRNGVHLCIDNNKNTTLDDDENSMPRLIYPNKYTENCPNVPAFIVIGGNTLSRGLTIEGLVSTYFARPVNQGDTLMQMGRWFGYRNKYELLPRLWISKDTERSFEELVDIDVSLREFIEDNYNLMTPSDYPPKVKKFPKAGHLTKITSSGKRRAAVETGFDFDGTLLDTNSFPKDESVLRADILCAEEFLGMLSKPVKSEITEAYVWYKVSSEVIFNNFLDKFIFSQKQNSIHPKAMKEWIKNKPEYYNWNVIAAGIKDGSLGKWNITDDISINKIGRGAVNNSENEIYLGTTSLSSPLDRVADIDLGKLSSKLKMNRAESLKKLSTDVRSNWRSIRNDGGVGQVPTLLIYCLSKDYEPDQTSSKKTKLGVDADVIGITFVMPGMKTTKAKAEYLQIPPEYTRGKK